MNLKQFKILTSVMKTKASLQEGSLILFNNGVFHSTITFSTYAEMLSFIEAHELFDLCDNWILYTPLDMQKCIQKNKVPEIFKNIVDDQYWQMQNVLLSDKLGYKI